MTTGAATSKAWADRCCIGRPTVDTHLSIRYEPVLQCNLRKGDRVYFPDRDETHEVTFIHPEAAGRWEVHWCACSKKCR